jgi:hypothetical protein
LTAPPSSISEFHRHQAYRGFVQPPMARVGGSF